MPKVQKTEALREIEELRGLLQRLRSEGHPRTEELHDTALLNRFLALRASVRFMVA